MKWSVRISVRGRGEWMSEAEVDALGLPKSFGQEPLLDLCAALRTAGYHATDAWAKGLTLHARVEERSAAAPR